MPARSSSSPSRGCSVRPLEPSLEPVARLVRGRSRREHARAADSLHPRPRCSPSGPTAGAVCLRHLGLLQLPPNDTCRFACFCGIHRFTAAIRSANPTRTLAYQKRGPVRSLAVAGSSRRVRLDEEDPLGPPAPRLVLLLAAPGSDAEVVPRRGLNRIRGHGRFGRTLDGPGTSDGSVPPAGVSSSVERLGAVTSGQVADLLRRRPRHHIGLMVAGEVGRLDERVKARRRRLDVGRSTARR